MLRFSVDTQESLPTDFPMVSESGCLAVRYPFVHLFHDLQLPAGVEIKHMDIGGVL